LGSIRIVTAPAALPAQVMTPSNITHFGPSFFRIVVLSGGFSGGASRDLDELDGPRLGGRQGKLRQSADLELERRRLGAGAQPGYRCRQFSWQRGRDVRRERLGGGRCQHWAQVQDPDRGLDRCRVDAGAQPSPGTGAGLADVAATSARNAWAVGSAGGKTLILRWNGTIWI